MFLADVGFGKTAIVLTILQRVLDTFADPGRVLVLAPLRVARNVWKQEAEAWEHTEHLRIAVAAGEPAKKRRAAIEGDAQIVTLNYENVPWFVDNYATNGKKPPFKRIVLDEIDKMKTPGSSRFRKLRRLVDHWNHRIGLTGTPTPNKLNEIWGEAFLVDGGAALGSSVTRFRKQFFYETDYMGYNLAPHAFAEEEIYRRIAPFTYRLAAKGNPGEVHVRDHFFDMDAKQSKAYLDMEKKLLTMLDDLDDPVVAKSAAVCGNKLTQIASGFAYYERDDAPGLRETVFFSESKLKVLEEIVSELQGHQVLVVYEYKAQLEMIEKRFPKAWVLDKGAKGDAQLAAWNRGEGEMLVFHPQSAGHGLNMHIGGCHHLVYLTLPWSWGLYGQVNGRIDRRGQKHPVYIHRLLARDTIDERRAEVIEQKKGGERALLDAMKRWTEERGGRR